MMRNHSSYLDLLNEGAEEGQQVPEVDLQG
jgi:hypothetical protein